MKPLYVAAALALLAGSAMAEVAVGDRPARPGPNSKGDIRSEVRAKNEEMREMFKADNVKRKAEFETARNECHARVKAAETPEQKQGVIADCRAKADAMRNERRAKRDEMINKRRAEMDAHHADMKKRHEEMRARNVTPAPEQR